MKIENLLTYFMTVKKAIKILDWWIEQKQREMKIFTEKWDFHITDPQLAQILLKSDKVIISNLETIKKELVPDCKHPEKMRDKTPDGKMYCMNCNFDL